MARRISKPEKGKSRKMESDSDWWKRMKEKENNDRDDDWGEEVDWDEFDKKMEEAFGDWGEDDDWGE